MSFLKHAGVWLGCRLVVMGGEIEGPLDYYGGMEWFMLGYHDLAHEMRLICEENNICGARLTASKMRKHFTECPKRPRKPKL